MEIYQTEEQQVEAIKSFWSTHGNSVIGGIVIGIAGFVGVNMYQNNQLANEQAISDKYEEILKIADVNKDEFIQQGERFISENNDSNYAVLTSLSLAKQAAEKSDWTKAAEFLQKAVSLAPTDNLKAIAAIRLARVQIQLEQFDVALTTLAQPLPEAYKATVEEVKGDAYLLQNNTDAARTAYQLAAQASGEQINAGLQMKLDDLAQTVNLTQ